MNSIRAPNTSEVGFHLVDSISIPDARLNFLFAALFLTSLAIFTTSNLLLMDAQVFLRSAQIALPCWAMLLLFYAISRTTHSTAWGLVLTYGLMALLVFARQTWLVPVMYALALAALGYALRFLRLERRQWVTVLLMAGIAAAAIIGVDRGRPVGFSGTFDMLNRLNAGTVTTDTMYHASIAAMLKNYGVISTGLNGLVETPYHVLSHLLFASISLLSKIGVIEVYGVVHWLLFAPFLVFGVVACPVILDRDNRLQVPLVWGVACVLLAAIPVLFQPWAVWGQYFVSESYMVALGLFLLGFPLLFKQRLIMGDLILILVLTVLMTLAKMSVGPIFAGLWLVRVLFVRGKSIGIDLATLTLSATAAVWTVLQFAGNVPETFRISPLSFVVSYSFLGDALLEVGGAVLQGTAFPFVPGLLAIVSIMSFFIFHFLINWLVAFIAAYKYDFAALFASPLAIYSLAAASVGVLFMLVVQTPGVNNYWFSNVSLFVALPGFTAWTGQWLEQRRVQPARVLGLGIVLACLFGARGFYQASSLFPEHAAAQPSVFITTLMDARESMPLNVVLKPTQAVLAGNPIRKCTAQPFAFPAVSERPWVGVVLPREDCTYQFYGYDQYGITSFQQTITMPPQILPGMDILNWPDDNEEFAP